jgi:hypothetical protein
LRTCPDLERPLKVSLPDIAGLRSPSLDTSVLDRRQVVDLQIVRVPFRAFGQRLQFATGEVLALVAEGDALLFSAFGRLARSLEDRATAMTAAIATYFLDGYASRFEATPTFGRHRGKELIDVGVKEVAVEAIDSADGRAILECVCVHVDLLGM